ncbi:flagellar protein FliT [Nitrosomonas sp. HPC101]|uniref:flagellar protein FliT n=1 Tax=Nitrosomonas sp. HPC101 TaxID=1658667 RepID=UPI001369C96F|nr:flagellar protein FliT [Nitrosomonas sp. HPC101]MXS84659.1 flagellar protein FliT [Nitrosomonas sp. HPC101]
MSFDSSSSNHPPDNGKNEMQVIATYEAILAIADQMLQAARNSDWDELVALEHDCKHLANRLMKQHTQQPLNEAQQKKKFDLIQQILARDAEIRAITEPQMTLLQNMLTTNGN